MRVGPKQFGAISHMVMEILGRKYFIQVAHFTLITPIPTMRIIASQGMDRICRFKTILHNFFKKRRQAKCGVKLPHEATLIPLKTRQVKCGDKLPHETAFITFFQMTPAPLFAIFLLDSRKPKGLATLVGKNKIAS